MSVNKWLGGPYHEVSLCLYEKPTGILVSYKDVFMISKTSVHVFKYVFKFFFLFEPKMQEMKSFILVDHNPYSAATECKYTFATSIMSGQPLHMYSLTRLYTVG